MVTIKDVAEKASVNASTVSRTLKNSSSISQQTKEKVRKAMKELGYVPNVAAQMLASGLTNCVGVVLPPLTNQDRLSQPFFMEILTSINAEAKKQDLTVSIATGESLEDLAEQVQLMHRQKRADGFIILYSDEHDPVRNYLMKKNIPFSVVGVDEGFVDKITYIDNDNHLMGRTAVEYLRQNGHKRILFVTDDLTGKVFQERYAGYQEAAERLEIEAFDSVLFDRKRAETLQALMDAIEEHQITGLIAIDDMLAVRMIQWLSFYGLKVPDDLSIISFNNSTYAKIIHPYLTTFDINIAELGKTSLLYLLRLIKEPTAKHEKIIVPFELKERESVIPRRFSNG